MKKQLLLLISVLLSFGMSSQSVFDKYNDMDEVTSVVVNQRMFKMLSDIEINDPESEAFIGQAGMLESLTVYSSSSPDITLIMKNDVADYISASDLEELMIIKDGDSNIKFYILEGSDDNNVKELLMLFIGFTKSTSQDSLLINGKQLEIETVLLSLKGNINLREVSKLMTKLNITGGDLLKNVN